MKVSFSEAKAQLSNLVRRAEAGDEVILTRHGQAVARLVPVTPALDKKFRRAVLDAARISGAARVNAGPSAARSQDFLYDITSKPPSTIEWE